MPQVLAPRLELLGCSTDFLTQMHQSFAEAVRIEIRQPRALECRLENLPNRRRVRPVFAFEANYLELPINSQDDLRRRE